MIKKFKKYKQLIIIGFFSVVTIASYLLFSQTSAFDAFLLWTQKNRYLFIISLFAVKFAGVVWPPIPGGLLTLAAIPILGWQTAYIIDLLGSEFGSSVAYFLGKTYGYPFLGTLFDKTTIDRIKGFKIKKNREIEAVIILRVLFGTTIVEAVSYAAGLLQIRFNRFIIGAILSHMLVGIPIFYVASNFLGGKNFLISGLVLIFAVFFIWKFRTRYFE